MATSLNNACIENQKLVSICIVDVHIVAVSNVINTESLAVGAQQYLLTIVALHMSLPTIRSTIRSSCKIIDIFVRF